MNFSFSNDFDQTQELNFQTCCHLRDTALELDLDVSALTTGLSVEMQAEQLQVIEAALQEAIAEALALEEWKKRRPCHIGPYDDVKCTICGLPKP